MELENVLKSMYRLHKELMRVKNPTEELKMREQFVEICRQYSKLLYQKNIKNQQDETKQEA